MTKKNRTSKKNFNKERRFGVILENIDSKIDLVVEGHQSLDKKIDKNYQELKDFRSEVNYKFEVAFDELHLIRNELKEKVGRDEFIVLEKRVAKIEKSMYAHK